MYRQTGNMLYGLQDEVAATLVPIVYQVLVPSTSDSIAFFSAWEKKRKCEIETNWYTVGTLNCQLNCSQK